jgi:hypothetical protein
VTQADDVRACRGEGVDDVAPELAGGAEDEDPVRDR